MSKFYWRLFMMSNNIRENIDLVEIREIFTRRIREKSSFGKWGDENLSWRSKIEEKTIKMVEQKDKAVQKSQESWRKNQETFFYMPLGKCIQVVSPRGTSIFSTRRHFSVGWIH